MSGYAGFARPSLAVELAGAYFPFDENYLYGPKDFDNPVVRVYVHEVIHFWQTLSQGFLTKLALAEWQQLLRFEQGGSPCPDGDHAAALRTLYCPHPDLGFSTWNLYEALCRYWDVHILGPPKLLPLHPDLDAYPPDDSRIVRVVDGLPQYSSFAFDLLMGVEDAYAEPYRVGLRQWGSSASVILFPLVGYFALQSPRPMLVFADAVGRLEQTARSDLTPGLIIHEVWPRVFETVRQACEESCARLCDGAQLVSGWSVMFGSPLAQHPVYRYYLTLLKGMTRRWGKDVQFAFSTPGDPNSRNLLAAMFRPPLTSFDDGRWTADAAGPLTRAQVAHLWGSDPPAGGEALADAAAAVEARWGRLEQAALIASYAKARGPIHSVPSTPPGPVP